MDTHMVIRKKSWVCRGTDAYLWWRRSCPLDSFSTQKGVQAQ